MNKFALRLAWIFLVGSPFLHRAASSQQVATVPFRSEKDLPYVTCRVNDSGPLNCLLDTGSAMTGVSTETAKRLGLVPHFNPRIPRVDLSTQALDELRLSIGDISWSARLTSIAPADLRDLDAETSNGFHTDVVIGTELLQKFQVTLDFDGLNIRLSNPGTPPPLLSERLSSFVLGIPFAQLSVKTSAGHAAVAPFALDTGSRPPLILSTPFWSKQPMLAVDASQSSSGEALILSAIRIAHTTLHHVRAIKPENGAGIASSERLGGVMGAPILSHFIVIFDLPNDAVWMVPSVKHPPL